MLFAWYKITALFFFLSFFLSLSLFIFICLIRMKMMCVRLFSKVYDRVIEMSKIKYNKAFSDTR